jgi:hypothetical protein
MQIQELQTKLLGLLKSTYEPVHQDGAYLNALRTSPQLQMMKEICLWWRCLQIEKYCPLTSAWLRQQDQFTFAVEAFYKSTNVPAYIEQSGMAFLEYMLERETASMTQAIAAFEQAIIRIKRRDTRRFVVNWDHEPYALLSCLLQKVPYEVPPAKERYEITVALELPGMFSVERVA